MRRRAMQTCVRRCRCILWIGLVLAVCAAMPPGASGASTREAVVRGMDGSREREIVSSLEDDRLTVLRAGRPVDIAIDRVESLAFAPDAPAPTRTEAAFIVYARDGSRVPAQSLRLEDGRLTGRSAWGAWTCAVTRVEGVVRLSAQTSSDAVFAEVRTLTRRTQDQDAVVMQGRSGRLAAVNGMITRVDAEGIDLAYEGSASRMAWTKAPAVRFAGAPETTRRAGTLGLAGGAEMVFSTLTIRAGQVQAAGSAIGSFAAAFDEVRRIVFSRDDGVSLLDLEPVEFEQRGFFGAPQATPSRATASGHVLQLGGRPCRHAVEWHALTDVTYALDEGYDRLVGRVGIDDSRGFGAVKLTVSIDGRTLLENRLVSASMGTLPLDLDISGGTTLRIEVGYEGSAIGAGEAMVLENPRLVPAPRAGQEER